MPRAADDEDDWDEPDDDGDDTQPCPYCRKEIHEDAERCPHCGNYISAEDAPPSQPVWVIVGAVVCLALVALWIWKG